MVAHGRGYRLFMTGQITKELTFVTCASNLGVLSERLLTSPCLLSGKYPLSVFFNATSAGRLGTEMPAWRQVLNPQEIADVSEFVFQRFIQPAAGSSAPAKAVK